MTGHVTLYRSHSDHQRQKQTAEELHHWVSAEWWSQWQEGRSEWGRMMMCGGGFRWAGGRISFVLFSIWLTALYLQCATKGKLLSTLTAAVCVCHTHSVCIETVTQHLSLYKKCSCDMSHQFYVNISYCRINR